MAVAAVSFVTGLIAAALAVAVGTRALARTDIPLWPVPALSLARMSVGTAAVLAVAAVLALAVGTVLRRSATAVAAVIVVIFVPYLLALFPPVLAGPGNSVGGSPWSRGSGCCGSPRPPASPCSRRSPSILRSQAPSTPRMPGTTRSPRGRASVSSPSGPPALSCSAHSS